MAPLAPPSPQPAPQATIATAAAVTSATTAPTIILGKYQLGRLLGRGSFAKVYEARCVADGSVVAIKIIDKKSTIDAAMEPRIVREVAAMRRLQHHPNILKIHEVMATKSKIYLVMELASGGELFAKVLRHRRLSESAARRYFQQLASALYFCHQNGVTHRDIKPQNMLLDQDGNLKVSDFGLSALPEQLKNDLLHTACGTPAYTAPEVVARRGYNGAKADAWSCGVILFVMLAGYLPFNDNNLLAMYKKIQRRDYDFPSWISKPARSIIYKLLDPNPNTRMSIETVMKTAWFKKSLEPEGDSCSMFDSLKETKPFDEMVTAFDIISLSSGLDLSGLFETSKRREKRFTSRVSVEGVVEKVSEVGRGLGYRVEKKKGGGVVVGLGKWKVKVLVEAFQIAAETVVVEVKVVEGLVEDFEWEKMKEGLGDIVLSWHNDVVLDC